MGRLIKTISGGEFKYLKEKFQIPVKNEETGLLKYDLTNPFYEKIWPKTSNIIFFIIKNFRKKKLNHLDFFGYYDYWTIGDLRLRRIEMI